MNSVRPSTMPRKIALITSNVMVRALRGRGMGGVRPFRRENAEGRPDFCPSRRF